jgi:hypothetical protein
MSAGTEVRRLAKGSRLGPCEISSSIGAGGMGEVFRARDTRLHCDLADPGAAGRCVADNAR